MRARGTGADPAGVLPMKRYRGAHPIFLGAKELPSYVFINKEIFVVSHE